MEANTSNESILALDVDGIVIGVYEDFSTIRDVIDLKPYLQIGKFKGKQGGKRLLFNVTGVKTPMVAAVGLGSKDKADEESVRIAAATGVKLLRDNGAKRVGIASLGSAKATAEGVFLGLYRFDELKTLDADKRPTIEELIFTGTEEEAREWLIGKTIAECQNFARRMGELPSNIATPTYFVEQTKKAFDGLDNVKIHDYDEKWAEKQKMGAFLSVAKGSDEPAKFLVIEYKGGNDGEKPLAIVGKGITFDTGGISLKPSQGMGAMRGDCSGAAATIATLLGIAKLGLKINAVGVAPLTENMPGGHATKPSDVVYASNGKSIEIDNTDAEGRLILSDALVYTEKTYDPHTIIDIATLTGAMMIALGSHYIGTFTPSDDLWKELEEAGNTTGEKFWRMPLDKKYKKQIESQLADIKNTGGRPAGSITAAMFLKEFIGRDRWAHLDIAGVAWAEAEEGYKPKGNVGAPVRALIHLASKYSSS